MRGAGPLLAAGGYDLWDYDVCRISTGFLFVFILLIGAMKGLFIL